MIKFRFCKYLFVFFVFLSIISDVNSAPRRNSKRASVVGKNNSKRAATTSRRDSRRNSKRAAVTGRGKASNLRVLNSNVSTKTNVDTSASVKTSDADEKYDKILSEINFLKQSVSTYESKFSEYDNKLKEANTKISMFEEKLKAIDNKNPISNTESAEPVYTGKIFKNSEITLNEGQGYYLDDIIDSAKFANHKAVKFYFSKCGFEGYFSVVKDADISKDFGDFPIGGFNMDEVTYSFTDIYLDANTSYDLSNTFKNYSYNNVDYPIIITQKKNKNKGYSVYFQYRPTSAKRCDNYNFVKAVALNGDEDFVKIKIRERNEITSDTHNKLVWTGKIFKNPVLRLKENKSYYLRDLANFPKDNIVDKYGNNLRYLYVYVSECGFNEDNYIAKNDNVKNYSRDYAKELNFNQPTFFVSKGASDICKTNFIHVAGAASGLMYQDSVKVEFYKED